MPENSLQTWLRLNHCKGVGVSAIQTLIEHFGALESVFEAGERALSASGIGQKAVASIIAGANEQAVECDMRWSEQAGQHIIPLNSNHYPERLRSIGSPPPVLYVKGDVDVLHTPQLAIVGSRKPTHAGRETAQAFSKSIAATGLTITSGMALGIDAASHQGALLARGLTIAVAATGLDRIYPAQHRELAGQIIEEGAIVSEFPIGTTVRPEFFPRRNRIISGLSLGVLVVEAAVRSGTLTTARHASEQGRDVFAVPGSIRNPLSRGCHALIKQGAKLIETPDDILEELASQLTQWHQSNIGYQSDVVKKATAAPSIHQEAVDPAYQQLINYLDDVPQTVDALVERSGHSAAEIASMLLMLELQGHVSRADGNRYVRVC